MVGSVYAAWLVHKKEKTVGDYVLFGSYIMQLMVPLNWMGTLYRYAFGYFFCCQTRMQKSNLCCFTLAG